MQFVMSGRGVLLISLLFATAINILHLVRDEPLHRSGTADIIAIALKSKNVRDVHNFAAALGQIAPGVTLLVPADRRIRRGSDFNAKLFGLGRIKGIKREKSKTFREPIEIPAEFIVARGEVWSDPQAPRAGRPGETWAIAVGKSPPKQMLLLSTKDFDHFVVDPCLIDDHPKQKSE